MAVGNLTKRAVDAAKASIADVFVWDNEVRGFGLKITPRDKRIFLLQYRMGGRGTPTRRYTIGTYGSPWTPKAARAEAGRLLELVRKGVDPLADKQERLRIASDLAFSPYADMFVKEYICREWKASHSDAERIFKLHLKPVLKNKPLPSIRKADIAAVYDAVPAHHIALRRKVHAVLGRMFRWAVARGDIERSPLDGVEAPPAPASRDRWLSDAELRLVWLAADTLEYPFGPMYRLLIGTGQRREEVAALNWREINRASAEWHLPSARSKNKELTIVHLSAPMIEELDRIAGGSKWPKKGLVFSTTGSTPVSGYSRAKVRLDKAMLSLARREAADAGECSNDVEVLPWRTHDIRRTLATGFQRMGVRFEVTEAVLNHVSGARSGVAGVYQRHSWTAEKKDALDAWAAYVARAVSARDGSRAIPCLAPSQDDPEPQASS